MLQTLPTAPNGHSSLTTVTVTITKVNIAAGLMVEQFTR
jgi:hypothetical protein